MPQDEAGFPDLEALLGTPEPGTLVYTCGPTGLLDAVEAAVRRSWPAGSPAPGAVLGEGRAGRRRRQEFELVLQRSGLTLTVPADSRSSRSCEAAGVSVVGSCLEGVCGTCETEIIDGDVDHRDSILNDEEKESNEFMMICVSRCRSDTLTLDL